MYYAPSLGIDFVSAKLDGLIAKRWLGLRFDPALERDYETATIRGRSRTVRFAMAVGMLLLTIGLLKDINSFASLAEPSVFVRLLIVAPLHLFASVVASRRFPVWLQGASVILAVLSVVTLVPLLGIARDPANAEGYLVGAGAMAAIVNLTVPLRFKHACVYVCLTIAILNAATVIGPESENLNKAAGITAFLSVSLVLSLAFVLRLEVSSRRGFLLGLRDKIQTQRLIELNERFHSLSNTDQLTGLANRRSFDSAFEQLWSASLSSGDILGLLMVDIDYFKDFNDRYGHVDGDACLQMVSTALSNVVQSQQGFIARYGGEEFVALFSGLPADACAEIGEELRSRIERQKVSIANGVDHVSVTVSIGITNVIPHAGLTPRQLLVAADEALYKAKASGRNTVILH